jgi:hypothetical protein
MEAAEPNRPYPLREKDDDISMQANMLNSPAAMRTAPVIPVETLNEEPTLAMFRSDIAEPKDKKSKMLQADPSLPIDRTLMVEPRDIISKTETLAFNEATDLTLSEEPRVT